MMQSIKKKENFLEPNDNCDVALHVTHKSFLSISSSVFPHSLSFFQIKTSQPFIILMGHAQRARNLRIPLFIPSKLFGYIAWECVIISNVIFSYHPNFYCIPSKISSSNQFYLPYLLELEPLLELGPMTPNAWATAHQRMPVGRCGIALPVFPKN